MRLCIPTVNAEGLEARVSGHFGSAPHYTLLDTETGAVDVVDNTWGGHAHGHGHGHGHGHTPGGSCRPLLPLIGHSIDAVVCRGLGRGAYARFLETELDVFGTHATRVREILEEAREGRLTPIEVGAICGGRHRHGAGHRHGHEDGEAHGHGSGCRNGRGRSHGPVERN